MLEDTSTTPKLLASSEEAGWEEMALYAYHEPTKIEGWTDPGTLDSSLVLITRSAHIFDKFARTCKMTSFLSRYHKTTKVANY